MLSIRDNGQLRDLKKLPFLLLVASALAFGFVPSTSHAAPCTVDISQTNPDGSVNSSSDCGLGNSGNNDGAGEAGALALFNSEVGGTWAAIDTDQAGGADGDNNFSFTGTTSGTFSINTTALNLAGFTEFIIVLKDGNIIENPTPPPDTVGWEWFLLDGTNVGTCAAGFLCGTWSMFGVDGTIHEISHMSLYGTTDGTTSTTQTEVPEPASLLLLGSGLLMVSGISRKYLRSQK